MRKLHSEGQFVICGGSDEWIGTAAKTLRGAKVIAGRTYQLSLFGKIEVAQVRGEHYVRCAVRRGYAPWTSE